MSRFNIDYFEFAFLVEACIPPRPIARAMFWQNVIDKHFDVLTSKEREHLYNWITKNNQFDINNEDCSLFEARYNPENQFLLTVNHNGKISEHHCFLWKGEYHKSKNTTVLKDYITEVNPLKSK